MRFEPLLLGCLVLIGALGLSPTVASQAPASTLELFFHQGAVPVGNADVVADDPVMSTTKPTGAAPALVATGPAHGSNSRTIYDGTWLYDKKINLTNASIQVTWWAVVLDAPTIPTSWYIGIYSGDVGSSGALVQSKTFNGADPSPGLSKYTYTLPDVSFAKEGNLIVVIHQTGGAGASDPAEFIAYDAASYPSGILITFGTPAPVGAAAPTVTLTSDKNETTAAPGAAAMFALNVTNTGAYTADLTLNATGDASVGFNPANLSIKPGASGLVNASVEIPDTAKAGDSFTVRVQVGAAGAEVANQTLKVTVVAASGSSGGSSATGAPSGSNATTNDSVGAKAGSDKKAVPGVELPLAAAMLLGVALLARRRLR